MRKLIMIGFGIAFLAYFLSLLGKEYTFIAGLLFVGIVILGVIGIIDMRRKSR